MNRTLMYIHAYLFVQRAKTFFLYTLWGRQTPQKKIKGTDPYEYGETD